jgi:hypothetical protein
LPESAIGGNGGVREEVSREKSKVNAEDKREKLGLMVFGGGLGY